MAESWGELEVVWKSYVDVRVKRWKCCRAGEELGRDQSRAANYHKHPTASCRPDFFKTSFNCTY